MVNSQKAVAETKLLREIPQPLARADLLVQDTNVKVTAIQLNKTKTGLQLIIKTADGQKLVPLILPEANRLVIELTDATLDLATGNDFQETNPTLGIAAITATQVDEGNIQILIIGENNSPSAAVIPSNQGLVLTVNPEGNIAPAKPDTSINVIATGQGNDDNYFVPNATTATRTDTPILDTPQSIQIIPREVLQDQQVIRLDEALRNVSGVTFGGTDLGRDLDFSIRGFDDATILRNGFRQFDAGGTFPETANLKQIEVLKGPAAVLFGEIQPGGVINLVSKRPLSEPYYDIQAQFGNRNLFRPSIDISGPLTSDGSLLYRLNALYQSGDEIQDFETDIERFFISPVITWKIGDRTDLTIELEYLDEERPPTFGIP
ncbi:MAG: TonB-dependent receptor plug domain-containing protein, partial [Cyanobacteria bacterium J06638_38]